MKKKNKKLTTISGPLMHYDVKTPDGIIYTKECALNILEQATEDIKNENLLGELGYPDIPEITLGNVSHRVIEMHLNPANKRIEGTFEILETPKGKRLLELINGDPEKFNEMFTIRSRGTGNVNKNREVENYTLYSFDIIPKTEDAFNKREDEEKYKV